MMSERQRNFRANYVANISPWYSGLVHFGVMYGVGLAGNFVEWGMHRVVMHRKVDV